jgi:hypothetical protein
VVRRWLPLLAVAALLAAAFAAAALSEPQFDVRPPSSAEEELTRDPSGSITVTVVPEKSAEPVEKSGFVLPAWIETVLGVLCAAIVLLIAGVLIFFALRDSVQARGRPIEVDKDAPKPASHAAEVAAALDAGLDELSRSGSDPRSVVIGCWVRLEEAAASAGTPRHPSDAPSDLVLRLLAGHQISRPVLDRLAHQISRPVLDRLAAVYLAARYSFGDVDESMRSAAVSALQRLRAELDVTV